MLGDSKELQSCQSLCSCQGRGIEAGRAIQRWGIGGSSCVLQRTGPGRTANFLGRQFCGLSYCALWDSVGARGAGREKEANATCLEPRVEWVVPLGARPASFASHPRSFPWAGGSCPYKTCPLCFHSLSLPSMSEEEGSCLCGERLGPD